MGRVRYGVRNLKAIFAKEDELGNLTYDTTPVDIPGAKSITFDPQGDTTTESADDIDWYEDVANNGYTFTIEVEDTAKCDEFTIKAYGHTKDETTGMVVESKDDVRAPFALLGQFGLAGDSKVKGKRFCFYYCKASRYSLSGATNESGKKTIATNSISGTALPRVSDGAVKTTAVSSDTCYENWFTKVPEKGVK